MKALFHDIEPSAVEIAMSLPGDDIITTPTAVMNTAFSVPARPEEVWPWFMQLCKNRAGWYFPRSVERFIPRHKRALHSISGPLQDHKIGDMIDDWGGKDGYLEVVRLTPPHTLVYMSTRAKLSMSWAITLWPTGNSTRVVIRLRLTSTGRQWFIKSFGGPIDRLTVLGLAKGMQERLRVTG